MKTRGRAMKLYFTIFVVHFFMMNVCYNRKGMSPVKRKPLKSTFFFVFGIILYENEKTKGNVTGLPLESILLEASTG